MARTKETAHRPSQELEEELAGLGATPAVDARLHADGGTAAEIFREAFDRGADAVGVCAIACHLRTLSPQAGVLQKAGKPPAATFDSTVIEPRHHSPTCDA